MSQNWPPDGCGIFWWIVHSVSLFDHRMERSEENSGIGVGVCCAAPIVVSGSDDADGSGAFAHSIPATRSLLYFFSFFSLPFPSCPVCHFPLQQPLHVYSNQKMDSPRSKSIQHFSPGLYTLKDATSLSRESVNFSFLTQKGTAGEKNHFLYHFPGWHVRDKGTVSACVTVLHLIP